MMGLGTVAANVVQLLLRHMTQVFAGSTAQSPLCDEYSERDGPLRHDRQSRATDQI